ncbi:amidohydrolase [Micrococcus endophyticus]|uniref:amidohydrolase n=1 Tax=Micrococcus endophyticus TaxID=455343 RepID=UPI0034CEB6B3
MTAVPEILRSLPGEAGWQEELYKHLHANPELSMQETETAAEITRRLEEHGYTTHQIGGGVVGVLENGPGKTVLFRADFDALPVKEETGLDYASTVTAEDAEGNTVPVMHACGHDMHVTTALGAAKSMAENKDAWSGTYLALFQPGEETAEGAQSMVDAGLVSQLPTPDVALSQHVLAAPEAGKVAITDGAALSTAVSVKITVYGKGSHGSMPHLGVDPVVLAAAIVTRLQTVVAREIAPGDFGVVTVGSLQAGSKANIIPDHAVLRINFRAYSEEIRQTLVDAVERIVRAECEAARSPREPEFEYSDRFPLTNNSTEVTDVVREALQAALGEENVLPMSPLTASEDFSVVPDAFGTPYCYWGFGGFTADQDAVPNHNPKFAPAIQPTMTTGTTAAVAAVMAFLAK